MPFKTPVSLFWILDFRFWIGERCPIQNLKSPIQNLLKRVPCRQSGGQPVLKSEHRPVFCAVYLVFPIAIGVLIEHLVLAQQVAKGKFQVEVFYVFADLEVEYRARVFINILARVAELFVDPNKSDAATDAIDDHTTEPTGFWQVELYARVDNVWRLALQLPVLGGSGAWHKRQSGTDER